MRIEVAYATPQQQFLRAVDVTAGTLLKDAIEQSGILQQCPEINLATCKTGIFSKPVPLTYVVQENDRIEIYRPLLMDPKKARFNRMRQERLAMANR